MTYPASGWREMFSGVNKLPVCALVMPREILIARLRAFKFRHDLSEDYALFLLVLTDPALPALIELPGAFGHISLRPGEVHSVTMTDRRPWACDIALYLADLTRTSTVAGPGQWALLTGNAAAPSPGAAFDAKAMAELRAALAGRERQIRLMRREIAQLRAPRPDGADPQPRNAPPARIATAKEPAT